MSKVSIQGDASGTGTLTIAAPNTNSNYTLTLPTNTGTVMTSASDTFAGGLTLGGDLTLDSNGIYLGGTVAANYLDDYEEGTWTATLTSATPPTTPPTSTCNYTKVGDLVTVFISFRNVDTSGGSGDLYVTGLPFTVSGYGAIGVCQHINACTTADISAAPTINDTYVLFITQNNGNPQDISAGSGRYLAASVTYRTT